MRPCPLRNHQNVHQAVRTILSHLGLKVREMRHSGNRAICCGEGGSVGLLNPDMAGQWGKIRRHEAGEDLVITYCAGCTGFLARAGMKVAHLGDLLVNPEKALNGKLSMAGAPLTYINRIRLKKSCKGLSLIRHKQFRHESHSPFTSIKKMPSHTAEATDS